MSEFIKGLILGFSYTAPIGALNLYVIQAATHLPLRRSALVSALVAANDILLAAVCAFGMGFVLQKFPTLKTALLILGAGFLLNLGLSTVRSYKSAMHSEGNSAKDLSICKIASSALVLTWLNPQALIDGSLLLGSSPITLGVKNFNTFFLGVILSSALWYFCLTLFVNFLKKRSGRKILSALNLACGLVLILLSMQMAFNATKAFAICDRVIKVAVLDNLKSEKMASEEYTKDYLKGIDLGMLEAKKKGILLETKTFFFSRNKLEIFDQVGEIKKWGADLVIAPRSSDLFLMLRESFPDTLVISPLATADEISSLPKNFYSISPPNSVGVKAMADFVKKNFPKARVYPVVQLDCVNCRDYAEKFKTFAVAEKIRVVENSATFLTQEVESKSVFDLIKDYREGDIFLLPNTSYVSGVLMGRISDYIKKDGAVFLGGDGWGDMSVGYAGKFASKFSYAAYRSVSWSQMKRDEKTKRYLLRYREAFKEESHSTIGLVMYSLIDSVSTIVEGAKFEAGQSQSKAILNSFYKLNVGGFSRPSDFAFFKISANREVLAGLVKTGGLK